MKRSAQICACRRDCGGGQLKEGEGVLKRPPPFLLMADDDQAPLEMRSHPDPDPHRNPMPNPNLDPDSNPDPDPNTYPDPNPDPNT